MFQGVNELSWEQQIKNIFPSWQTEKGINEFNSIKCKLEIKQSVKGKVIARAEFGVWVDIGVGYPALLLVVNFANSNAKAKDFIGYPSIGDTVEAKINALGSRAEIGLSQIDRYWGE